MINTARYTSYGPLPAELDAMLALVGKEPTLEQVWHLMDFIWRLLGCESRDSSAIQAFYAHPVWLFNGLFIEQHDVSLENRRQMAEYAANLKPGRIADYGGGFGSLGRMLCEKLPKARVEIVEPFPSALGVRLAESFPNLSYEPELTGTYDLIIATDVLEHVEDPLELTALLASHLAPGGKLLLANCFYPVILCHLPETFHFRYSFKYILKSMHLKQTGDVSYAQVFVSTGKTRITGWTRFFERGSRLCFPVLRLSHRVFNKLKSLLR